MHLLSYHAEHNTPVLEQFVRDNPLGILTTAIWNPSHPFIQSSHIPWVIDAAGDSGTPFGKLRGHVARQNPQAKAIIEAVSSSSDDTRVLEEDVLVLFNAAHHHYITAKFYRETKPETGKTVPTWDYEAVQIYGRAKIYHDSRSEPFHAFLNQQLADLTHHAETSIMGYGGDNAPPWKVTDAPESYIEIMKKNIIGIEIEITSMGGRWKMSQEKKKGDRDGVIEGIRKMDSPIAAPMAEMLEKRAREFDERKEASRKAS